MSYDYRSQRDGISPGPGTAARDNARAPGRRTLTESLPAQPEMLGTSSDPERGALHSYETDAGILADGDEHRDTARDARREIDYPYRAQIESATRISIPGRAIVDPQACETRGVLAFADGDVAYFARSTPDLHVAAHEAVHLMQHAGKTGDAGLGAEEHAHEVANAIAAGDSAEQLLGHGMPVAPAVRDYTVLTESEQSSTGHWKIGKEARIGDEGRTVTPSEETHEAFADPTLISEANRILKAKKSGVEIEPGGPGPSGPAPDGSGMKTTVKVNYKIVGDRSENKLYPHDCGSAARETMGEAGKDVAPRGIYKDAAGNRKQTAQSYDPASYRDEIYVRTGLGATPAAARAAYEAMTTSERNAYDKKHGINRYAAPGIGEAFTQRRSDHLITDWSAEDVGYNFHWGGVIMVAGGDRVTFENYVDPDEKSKKNDSWFFATYGPPSKPGQTWHERWASNVGGSERLATTLAAATSADPSPFIHSAAAMTTADVIRRMAVAGDQGERMALAAEAANRRVEVTVEVMKAQEGPDNVYIKARAGRVFQTKELKMRRGQRHTFQIPVDALLPIVDQISIEVRDADFGPDDTISNILFTAPFRPQVDNRPWDGAEYHTTVRFDR